MPTTWGFRWSWPSYGRWSKQLSRARVEREAKSVVGGLHRYTSAGHRRSGGNGGKIRNPKSETNSNDQRSKSSKPGRRGRADWSGFEDWSFEFGACFGFRISGFGFVLAGQRCPAKKLWDV